MTNKELNLPMFSALMKYANEKNIPFHMPGHKMGKKIEQYIKENIFKIDVTEIPGTDNLFYPEECINDAQKLASLAFGSDKTYFLVNGASGGLHSIILTMAKPGEKIIVNRDCHKSVINGMILAGVEPVYISSELIKDFSIPGEVSVDALKRAIVENKDAKAVLITSPNYYGVVSNIKEIANITHENNMILAVDEAHGTHLNFSKKLPNSAITEGADICVQSAHKTLPSITQTAYLHVKGTRIDLDMLEFNIRMIHTTSPSYVFLVFLDYARAVMEAEGEKTLDSLLINLDKLIEEVQKMKNFNILTEKFVIDGDFDKTKIVINVSKSGKSGYEIEKILRSNYKIQIEMSDPNNILAIVTVGDNEESILKLIDALKAINNEFNQTNKKADIYNIENNFPIRRELTLKDAYLKKWKKINIDEAIGMISKEIITPYPPGVPLLCPGELVTKEIVKYIKMIIENGGTINGVDENYEIKVIES
jgi:lysine decarboxylase